MTEPRFCPFCGSEWVDVVKATPDGFAVNCHECGAIGPLSEDSESDAIEQWNDRFRDECPDCGADGTLERPYPGDCPQNHIGKDAMLRAKRSLRRRRQRMGT